MIRSPLLVLALSAMVAAATSCSSPGAASDSPNVVRFEAAPPNIASGESAELSWEVTGAQDVSIDSGVGEVSGSSVQVRPTTTTTYTLTATNERGSTTANPIVFTANNPTTGWAGMRLAATSDAGSDFLERCIFEYGNKVGGQNGLGPDGSYSEDAGGALWIGSRSNVNLNHNEFRFNKAPTFGGALMLISPTSSGVATGNNFHDNECTGPRTQFGGVGGAVNTAHLSANTQWTFRAGEFRNNRAPQGGALYFFDSNVTLDGIAMSGNTPNNWATPEPHRLTTINTPR